MKSPRFLLFLCTALLLTTAAAQELTRIPPMNSPVNDLIGLLEPGQRTALEQKLWMREMKTGNQVVILVVPSTGTEAIEQYSIRVFERWGVGRKGVDDGVLLTISADNSRIRLDTGYGVEGLITDVIATRIVRDVIVPRFEKNDYYGGLDAGVTAIHAELNKGAFPPPTRHSSAENFSLAIHPLLWLLFALLIVVAIVYAIIRSKRSRVNASGSQ